MRCLPVATIAIVALLSTGPSEVHAQLTLYDDFSATRIDPSRWQGSEGSAGPAAPNTDARRDILHGQLLLRLTSYGRVDSDSDVAGIGSVRLGLTDPGPIGAMQAKVTVMVASAQDCAANPTATRARAQIIGAFFNDGASSGPGDRTGDVFAGIQKVRDSNLGDRIEAFVSRCTNPTCSFPQATLGSHAFALTWTVGAADTLEVRWDPASNQFLFAVNPGTLGEERATIPYSSLFLDATAPVQDFKQLSLGNSVANCAVRRKRASVRAQFDDVMISVAPPRCHSDLECASTAYCAKALGDCFGAGSCRERPGACLQFVDLVCGCDGQTYTNEGCAAVAGVNVARRGSCEAQGMTLDPVQLLACLDDR